MQKNNTRKWKATQQKHTLRDIYRAAHQYGTYYVHFAEEGLQPVVVVPLQRWCKLIRKRK